jgi:O-acetyl-ADP-ribose deacetylase (regulator of RNase III)
MATKGHPDEEDCGSPVADPTTGVRSGMNTSTVTSRIPRAKVASQDKTAVRPEESTRSVRHDHFTRQAKQQRKLQESVAMQSTGTLSLRTCSSSDKVQAEGAATQMSQSSPADDPTLSYNSGVEDDDGDTAVGTDMESETESDDTGNDNDSAGAAPRQEAQDLQHDIEVENGRVINPQQEESVHRLTKRKAEPRKVGPPLLPPIGDDDEELDMRPKRELGVLRFEEQGVKVEICTGDIAAQSTEVLVDAANSYLQPNSGVALALKRAAGPDYLRECRQAILDMGPIPVSECRTTSAGQLRARYVIHAVGVRAADCRAPQESHNKTVATVYNALREVDNLNAVSVALPAIGTGAFRVPFDIAAAAAAEGTLRFMEWREQTVSMLKLIRFVLPENEELVDAFERHFVRVFQLGKKSNKHADQSSDVQDRPLFGQHVVQHDTVSSKRQDGGSLSAAVPSPVDLQQLNAALQAMQQRVAAAERRIEEVREECSPTGSKAASHASAAHIRSSKGTSVKTSKLSVESVRCHNRTESHITSVSEQGSRVSAYVNSEAVHDSSSVAPTVSGMMHDDNTLIEYGNRLIPRWFVNDMLRAELREKTAKAEEAEARAAQAQRLLREGPDTGVKQPIRTPSMAERRDVETQTPAKVDVCITVQPPHDGDERIESRSARLTFVEHGRSKGRRSVGTTMSRQPSDQRKASFAVNRDKSVDSQGVQCNMESTAGQDTCKKEKNMSTGHKGQEKKQESTKKSDSARESKKPEKSKQGDGDDDPDDDSDDDKKKKKGKGQSFPKKKKAKVEKKKKKKVKKSANEKDDDDEDEEDEEERGDDGDDPDDPSDEDNDSDDDEDEPKAKGRYGMYQKNLRLSPYGGDAYVEQYLAQAQRTAHLAGWPRKTWGARVIAALEGKARRIITEDHLDQNMWPSFETVAKLLMDNFGSGASPGVFQMKLMRRRRRDKETLADLAQSILELVAKAHPSIKAKERRSLATVPFVSALTSKEQRVRVMASAPSTLNEALKVALAYENAEKCDPEHDESVAKKGGKVRAMKVASDSETEEARAQPKAVPDRTRTSPVKKNQKRKRGPPSAEQPCYACGGTDHFANNCPVGKNKANQATVSNPSHGKRGGNRGQGQLYAQVQRLTEAFESFQMAQMQSQGQQEPRSVGPRPQDSRERGACFNCGQVDHWRNNCPYPKRPYSGPPRSDQQGNGVSRGAPGQPQGSASQ